jgi:tetratricopeptide (TPR) repeat protein
MPERLLDFLSKYPTIYFGALAFGLLIVSARWFLEMRKTYLEIRLLRHQLVRSEAQAKLAKQGSFSSFLRTRMGIPVLVLIVFVVLGMLGVVTNRVFTNLVTNLASTQVQLANKSLEDADAAVDGATLLIARLAEEMPRRDPMLAVLDLLNDAAEVYRQYRNMGALADVENKIGIARLWLGEYSEARSAFESAFEKFSWQQDSSRMLSVVNNMLQLQLCELQAGIDVDLNPGIVRLESMADQAGTLNPTVYATLAQAYAVQAHKDASRNPVEMKTYLEKASKSMDKALERGYPPERVNQLAFPVGDLPKGDN